MKKIFNILLIIFFVTLGVSIYSIKKYENLYIKKVADSAIYFQNPSRVLLKVSCLFDEAMFDLHKYKHHRLKRVTKAEILLLTTKNLLKGKKSYKQLIEIIDNVLDKISKKKNINEDKILREFHKRLNQVSFLEFQKSIEFFEKYKQDIQQFQFVLYTIVIIVFLLSIALVVILYQSNLLKRIRILSETDQLTKAYNRRKFFNEIENIDKEYSIIMFDIDHFKKVNDTYGHNKGDYVLKTLINLIKNNIRKDDMIFRWGGEEFFILFKNMNLIEAKKMAEKLRKIVENYDFDGLKVTISLSVISSKSNTNIEKIIKILDEGLYEAKNSGRNRVVVKGEI